MKKNKLISIIVPVYNTSKYIEKCLNSIKDAKTDDCEVIIINDGSKDNSEKLIKKFISSLPKSEQSDYRYIYKANKGLADTKNVGIKEAVGKYISVVDSDDYIDPNFYTIAIPYLDEYDVIIYDLYVVFENAKPGDYDYVARAFDDRFNDNLYQLLNGKMQGSSCNKIIKKDLYTFEFPVGKQYEDVAVTPFILKNTDKIKYLPYGMYYYLQRANSIVNTNSLHGAFYKICSNIQDVMVDDEFIKQYEEVVDVFFVSRTIENLEMNYKFDRKSFIENIDEMSKNCSTIIKYINSNGLIDKSNYPLTNNQKMVLRKIYKSMENGNSKAVKRVFLFRSMINYVRKLIKSFVSFLKSIVGRNNE